jgi:glutamyl-tRNA synthetase
MPKDEITTSLELSDLILCDVKLGDFTAAKLRTILMSAAEKFNSDRGKLLWPLRVALSGKEKSPPLFEIAEILGKEEALKRIRRAIQLLR